MQSIKSPCQTIVTSRKLVMPDQINPNGSLFGGVLMSWMDKAAYMSAQRHSGRPHVVTASIDEIQFHLPLRVGDHAVLNACVTFVGNTSMEIEVRVEKEDGCTGWRKLAASATMTFVALDENSNPVKVPPLVPRTLEEIERFDRSRARVKIRGSVRRWLAERFPRAELDSLGG